MGNAIFLAIAGNPKIEIRIAQFCCATSGAAMERLGFIALAAFKAFAPGCDVAPLTRLMKKFRAEKDDVIAQGRERRHAVRH